MRTAFFSSSNQAPRPSLLNVASPKCVQQLISAEGEVIERRAQTVDMTLTTHLSQGWMEMKLKKKINDHQNCGSILKNEPKMFKSHTCTVPYFVFANIFSSSLYFVYLVGRRISLLFTALLA